jgi:putative nucleotidyltransferase with HDIG domain
MYVAELDRPWRETPFLFQGFEIQKEEELGQLRSLCQHVFILEDGEAPGGAQRKPAAPPDAKPALSLVEDAAAPQRIPGLDILKKHGPGQHYNPRYNDQHGLEAEMPVARELFGRTRTLVFQLMEDARLGRSLDVPGAKQLIADTVDSILRNPDALACMTQMKKRDEYTALHSLRVCVLALTFGRHLDFSREHLELLGLGALLHDVGKMKVPTDILNKPGRLTQEEYEIVKRHVPYGVEILESMPQIPQPAIEVARSHHERYAGHGYIGGLKGDNIGLFGSIGAIVDCYDALTSDRIYHHGMPAYDALSLMYAGRRQDFHPELVEQFIQCMGIFPIGSVVELSTGSVGVVVSVNRRRRLRPRVALVLTPDKRPIRPARVIDLMESTVSGDIEIRHVLPQGSFGINPIEYLPLSA